MLQSAFGGAPEKKLGGNASSLASICAEEVRRDAVCSCNHSVLGLRDWNREIGRLIGDFCFNSYNFSLSSCCPVLSAK